MLQYHLILPVLLMTNHLKSKLGKIPCCHKNCTTQGCPYDHNHLIPNRCKRPRCDDEGFYAKWKRLIEEKENLSFAVLCSCSAKDPHFCKCASIV